jgi:hypothetical protein
MQRSCLAVFLLSAALAEAGEVPATERPRPIRAELDRFASILDETLHQVSRPSPASMLGLASATSAYYVRGLGAIFVASPRMLPAARPDGAIVARHRAGGREAIVPAPKRQRGNERPPQGVQLETIEAQARAMQEMAAQAQLQAERAFAEIVASIEGQASPNVGQRAASGRVGEPPSAPWGLVPPTTPPWSLWLEIEGTEDARTPEKVVDDVYQSVTSALANYGAQIESLAPDERATVIVDFTRPTAFAPLAQPDFTLSVQVKQGDLVAFRQGQLTADQLRLRFERQEY